MKKNLFILLGAIIITIVNVLYFNQLPDKIGMQISTSGDLRNYIPKLYFMIIVPLILVLDYIYTVFSKEKDLTKPFVIAAIILVLDIIIIFMNI